MKNKRKRVNEIKQFILNDESFPPGKSIHCSKFFKKLSGRFTDNEINQAINELIKQEEITGFTTGWLTRMKPLKVRKLTMDDIHWLCGTGRFAQ